MKRTERRYSLEELARRGNEIYGRDVRPHLSKHDQDKFVAVDIEAGAYEIDSNELAACKRLRVRHPDAQIWLVRVGSPFVYRFGRGDVRGPR